MFESRNLDLFLSGVLTRMKRASDVTGCTRVPILFDFTMVLSCIKVYSIAVCALMRCPKPIIHRVIRFQRVRACWRMTVKTFMAFLTWSAALNHTKAREPLAMASDEESSEDEADKDSIQPSVLKRRLNRIILICFYAFQTLRV